VRRYRYTPLLILLSIDLLLNGIDLYFLGTDSHICWLEFLWGHCLYVEQFLPYVIVLYRLSYLALALLYLSWHPQHQLAFRYFTLAIIALTLVDIIEYVVFYNTTQLFFLDVGIYLGYVIYVVESVLFFEKDGSGAIQPLQIERTKLKIVDWLQDDQGRVKADAIYESMKSNSTQVQRFRKEVLEPILALNQLDKHHPLSAPFKQQLLQLERMAKKYMGVLEVDPLALRFKKHSLATLVQAETQAQSQCIRLSGYRHIVTDGPLLQTVLTNLLATAFVGTHKETPAIQVRIDLSGDEQEYRLRLEHNNPQDFAQLGCYPPLKAVEQFVGYLQGQVSIGLLPGAFSCVITLPKKRQSRPLI
jgi:hypothetical protein